jgi:hypothetical protein
MENVPKSVEKLEVQSRAPNPNSSSKGVITGTGKVLQYKRMYV